MTSNTVFTLTALLAALSALAGESIPAVSQVPKEIRAYDIDFNWGPGGPNGFAQPGLWTDADPAKHVAWYRAMGANVIQTFCVSCNGYAWYKNGVVPEQPGLKHDFLREVVNGAHREGMLVLGYFCAGSNTRWGKDHPELSYGIPSEPHIPYTEEYLAYLDAAIRDAVGRTGIDGFMIDWLRMPTTRASNGGRWLECEKKLYSQLMGEPFPGEKELPAAKMTEYGRRAVDRCWGVIRKAAKETNPNCIVWLTCCDINDPHIANSRALRETDWLLNEAGDLKRTADAKKMIGPHTRLITCLANWNGQDPMQVVPAALKEGIGLYGFTRPGADSLLPLESLLARSVGELKGDEKNIAVLARAFHGAPMDSIRTADGRFVEKAGAEASAPPMPAEEKTTSWNGFKRLNFFVAGRPCFITQPAIAAPGRPWVWRTSFPDFHAEVDLELLRNGWAVAYIECLDLIGCDASLDLMDQFYPEMTEQRGFAKQPALEAVSRGGLHAYRYAARHPERIACIYADTPVMDLKSWPLGWPGAKKETADALKFYGFKNEAELRAWRGNPVDLLEPIAKAKIPLRHVISLNDRVVPPEQNTLEAQRRLQKLGHPMELVTVREGTAESNGHHFPLPEAFASARFVMRHTTVLPAGHEYFGLRDGLANSRAKFEREKTGRVAFLGGSITFNPGWRDAVMRYLQQRFPETKFDFIAAGIPSLGSVPHAFRLETDVLARGPLDLLFVEAAVNDHNYDGQTNAPALALRGMEGVVRHVRRVSPQTDIVELHFVHNIHLKTWGEGKVPYTIAAHEQVAERYGCPSVNLSREVAERIAVGQFTWAGDFRDLHPSPYGQQVYANSITRLLDAAWRAPEIAPATHPLPPPLDPASYDRGRFGDVKTARIINGFTLDPQWKPTDGKEARAGYVKVPALVATTPGAEFEFTFEGTGVGLMITSGPDARTIAFRIDGRPEQTVNTATQWSQSLHLPWALMLADSLPAGQHTVRVRLVDGALRVFHLLEN